MVKPPYISADPVGREIHFLRPCLKTLQEFPDDVRTITAHALSMAAQGCKHVDVKPLKGFRGASVQELAISHGRNAYRVIFTIQFPEAVYVIHVFQKKSHRGSETPRHEIERVNSRLGRSSLWRQQ